MKEFKVGDRVQIKGNTQHYVLIAPDQIYDGEIIGKDSEQLLVRLNKPVIRGTVEFHEVSVLPTMVLSKKE